MNGSTGYYLFLGKPIFHNNVKTIYGKSPITFWMNILSGVVMGLILDVGTNYIVFYAISSVFTPSEVIRFVVAFTGALLLGMADMFLIGAIRTIRRMDIFVVHMAFGIGCLTAVVYYDLEFSANPIIPHLPFDPTIAFVVAWSISIFSTLMEILLFQTADDLIRVRMAWDGITDPNQGAKFLGRPLFHTSIDSIYKTISEFHGFIWGGVLATLFRVGTIYASVNVVVEGIVRSGNFGTILISLMVSLVFAFVDFRTFSVIQLLFQKNTTSVYVSPFSFSVIVVTVIGLYSGAMPLINGGLPVGLAWGLSGSASALMVLMIQTLIDWGDVSRA